jgi:hypothetical protein
MGGELRDEGRFEFGSLAATVTVDRQHKNKLEENAVLQIRCIVDGLFSMMVTMGWGLYFVLYFALTSKRGAV